MHGRLKVKTSIEKELEKKKEREEKAKQFLFVTKKAFQKRECNELDEESLAISGQLLSANPDFYTLWNLRRETILEFKKRLIDDQIVDNCDQKNANLESFLKLCQNELQLTINCLKVNPKSYCVWHQRYWIIELMPNPDLKLEISLCNQFLEMDERNFHCWDYRRFVSKLAKIRVEEELDFTLEKIKQNFSNFSSWYHRSCLFTSAVNKENFDFSKQWEKEYELVENALFTDPSDQSAWFYHKWLLSTNYGKSIKHSNVYIFEKTVHTTRVVYDYSQSLLIVNLSRPIKFNPLIMVYINDTFVTDIEWNSASSDQKSNIWFSKIGALPSKPISKISFKPIPTFAISLEAIDSLDLTNKITENQNIIIWERNSDDSENKFLLEERYLQSLRTLLELEPNNKWINLSLAWIDPNKSQTDEVIDTLIKIDPLRVNYYNDLKSKMILRKEIESSQSKTSLSLNNINITALYYTNRLTHIKCLDLSHNSIVKLSKSLNDLVLLQVLIMDFNKIHYIDEDFKPQNLKVLSLNNNKIKEIKSLRNLHNLSQLEKLIINENPISTLLNTIPVSDVFESNRIQIITSDLNNIISKNLYTNITVDYNLF